MNPETVCRPKVDRRPNAAGNLSRGTLQMDRNSRRHRLGVSAPYENLVKVGPLEENSNASVSAVMDDTEDLGSLRRERSDRGGARNAGAHANAVDIVERVLDHLDRTHRRERHRDLGVKGLEFLRGAQPHQELISAYDNFRHDRLALLGDPRVRQTRCGPRQVASSRVSADQRGVRRISRGNGIPLSKRTCCQPDGVRRQARLRSWIEQNPAQHVRSSSAFLR